MSQKMPRMASTTDVVMIVAKRKFRWYLDFNSNAPYGE
jgi:hypothetical protein